MINNFYIGALHFGGSIEQNEVNKIISAAKEFKIQDFESAPIYGAGNSIKALSEALINCNFTDARISLKYGLEATININNNFSVKQIYLDKKRISHIHTKCLKDLKKGFIDNIQLHAFNELNNWEEVYDFFSDQISFKNIKTWGISNHSPEQLRFHSKKIKDLGLNIYPKTCQLHLNVIEQRALIELVPACEETNMVILVNRILARGILTSRVIRNEKIHLTSRLNSSDRIKNFYSQNHKKITEILKLIDMYAKDFSVSVEHIVYKWCIETNSNFKLILGVSNVDQLEDLVNGIYKLEKVSVVDEINSIINLTNSINFVNSLPGTYFEK